jgi:hypothetical protein
VDDPEPGGDADRDAAEAEIQVEGAGTENTLVFDRLLRDVCLMEKVHHPALE